MNRDREEIKIYTIKKVAEVLMKDGKFMGIHPSLILSKHAIYAESKDKFDIEKVYEEIFRNASVDEKLYRRYFDELKSIKKMGDVEIERFEMQTKSRVVIGLGDESVYEVSLRLDRNYGVPIIPGSALKGIARHYAKEFKKWDDEKIKKVFGDHDKSGSVISGSVIFFDAYPVPESIIRGGKLQLDLDIMNPHYNHYYREDEPPGDWGTPTPIFFLTVRPKVRFLFSIGFKKDVIGYKDAVKSLLTEALKEYGIGAKTSLGYGLFEEVRR